MTKRSQFIFSCGQEANDTCVVGLSGAKRFCNMLHPTQTIYRFKLILEESSKSGFRNIEKYLIYCIKFGYFDNLVKFEIINFGVFREMDIGLSGLYTHRMRSVQHLCLEMIRLVGAENIFSRLKSVKLISTLCTAEVLLELPDSLEKICLRDMDLSGEPRILERFYSLRKISLTLCSLKQVPRLHNGVKGTLYYLGLQQNYIEEITERLPDSLLYLNVSTNKIEKICHLPSRVVYVDVSYNKLKKLPAEALLCTRLMSFRYFNNPIIISIPHKRLLQNLQSVAYFEVDRKIRQLKRQVYQPRRINTSNGPDERKSIYQDNQNIHSSSIQMCFLESACNLFLLDSNCHLIFSGTGNLQVDKILLTWFRLDNRHSILRVTLLEVFFVVWKRINKVADAEVKDQLIQRLCEEVIDGQGMCFVGRMTRLVNTLVGFFDDITMDIGLSEQIYAKILQHKTLHRKIDRQQLEQDLSELQLGPHEIKVWVDEAENQFNTDSNYNQ